MEMLNIPFKVDLSQTEHDSTVLKEKSILYFKNTLKQLYKIILKFRPHSFKMIYRRRRSKNLLSFLTF